MIFICNDMNVFFPCLSTYYRTCMLTKYYLQVATVFRYVNLYLNLCVFVSMNVSVSVRLCVLVYLCCTCRHSAQYPPSPTGFPTSSWLTPGGSLSGPWMSAGTRPFRCGCEPLVPYFSPLTHSSLSEQLVPGVSA